MNHNTSNAPLSLSPEDRELEAALASLTPASAAHQRDALLFEAGRQSVRHRLWLWRSATGLAASLALAAVLTRPDSPALPRSPLVHEAPASRPSAPTPPTSPASQPDAGTLLASSPERNPIELLPLHPPDSYLALRQALLRRNGQLPPRFTPVAAPPPASAVELENTLESGLFGRGTLNRGDRS